MTPNSPQDWIAWAGVVIPFFALAWAAVSYALSHRREVAHREFERFFAVMDHLGKKDGSIASKMAAAYELRKYPEYKAVIVRLCDQAIVDGTAAKMLQDEMRLTAVHMKGL